MARSLSHILAEAAGETPPAEAIDRILEAVRTHLGMDIAFAAKFVDGRREFTHISADKPVAAKTLRSLGVGFGQGWHFSRPMPSVAVQQFLLGTSPGNDATPPARPAAARRTT